VPEEISALAEISGHGVADVRNIDPTSMHGCELPDPDSQNADLRFGSGKTLGSFCCVTGRRAQALTRPGRNAHFKRNIRPVTAGVAPCVRNT